MASQQTIIHGMQIPSPQRGSACASGFHRTRGSLHRKGRVTCDRRLLDDEHICALDTFIEMAREAGLRIQELTGGTDSNSNT